MNFRALRLPEPVAGQVWLASMPGRLEPWSAFLTEAERAAITHVVCLTPMHEIGTLSPDYREALDTQTFPFGWQHLPLQDYGAPVEAQTFRDGIERMAQQVLAGESLLLHCAAGIGRTGTAAACLLKRLGCDAPAALQRVRQAGSNPQSALQSGWIDLF